MDNWIKNLAIKALHVCRINKIAVGNHRQDMSLPVLEDLRNQGYSVVTWDSGNSTHSKCRDLNRQTWDMNSYLGSVTHDAGIFSFSHPGDQNCTLLVSGENLPEVRVDSYGDVDEMIGTSRPVKAPPAPKVKTKVLAPTPEPKVVEKPVEPKVKTKYVTPEVHKQIKDPFEKQKEQQELDREDWLQTLDKENVEEEEERPTQPTDEDREEWLRDLERETSLKRPARWIMGIFEKGR